MIAKKEFISIYRVDREKDMGLFDDLHKPEERYYPKPEEHHRSEDFPDHGGPMRLKDKEQDEDGTGQRHYQGGSGLGRHFNAFDSGEHRNGRSDNPVSVKETGADNSPCQSDGPHAGWHFPLS